MILSDNKLRLLDRIRRIGQGNEYYLSDEQYNIAIDLHRKNLIKICRCALYVSAKILTLPEDVKQQLAEQRKIDEIYNGLCF